MYLILIFQDYGKQIQILAVCLHHLVIGHANESVHQLQ